MGLFFRKSIGFGPARLNFSKSGVGASIGVKGARITATPTGLTYITVSSHGFYYRQALRAHQQLHHESTPHLSQSRHRVADATIQTADLSELVDSSRSELLKQLNERAAIRNYAPLVYTTSGICLVLAITSSQAWWALGAIALAAIGGIIHLRFNRASTTRLSYELNEVEARNMNLVRQAIVDLSGCHLIWPVITRTETSDQKRNAGASSLLRRIAVMVGRVEIPRVETNIEVPGIDVGPIKLFMLPDAILYWESFASKLAV